MTMFTHSEMDLTNVERGLKHEFCPLTCKWTQTLPNIRLETRAFAEGGMRAAFKMTDLSVKAEKSEFVAKICKDAKVDVSQYFSDVMMQSEARLWAQVGT